MSVLSGLSVGAALCSQLEIGANTTGFASERKAMKKDDRFRAVILEDPSCWGLQR